MDSLACAPRSVVHVCVLYVHCGGLAGAPTSILRRLFAAVVRALLAKHSLS